MTVGTRTRDADVAVARGPHPQAALEPRAQVRAGGGRRVSPERVGARGRAGGDARLPDRLAGQQGLQREREDHEHRRKQRDELDRRLARLAIAGRGELRAWPQLPGCG